MIDVHNKTDQRSGRLESTPPAEVRPGGRRTRCVALSLAATARELGQARMSVRVIDISILGCRIEISSGHLTEPWLWLSITGLETQYCRVAWHHNGFVGLEFAAPVNEAVLDRLLMAQSCLSESAVKTLRDIAARAQRLAQCQRNPDELRRLLELSRDCTVNAVSLGLRLCEGEPAEQVRAPLSASPIRRSAPDEERERMKEAPRSLHHKVSS